MAVINSTVPYANREAGVQNDAAQYAQISALPLARIRCPTLIVHGAADVTVPIAHSELAHSQIAGSQFAQLPGQDHWMVMTKHKELGDPKASRNRKRFVGRHTALTTRLRD